MPNVREIPLVTKRAGKRKNRNGNGPHKPRPGPNGPLKVQNSILSGEDNLPDSRSIALQLQSLNAGWMLQADTNLREVLITRLLNVAGDIIKRPLDEMSDLEFQRLLSIFRAVSGVEQKQQRIEIAKSTATIRALFPPHQPGNDLPLQNGTTVNIAVGSRPENAVRDIPTWMAVQQLLKAPEVQEAVKTLPTPQRMSDQLSPQAG